MVHYVSDKSSGNSNFNVRLSGNIGNKYLTAIHNYVNETLNVYVF